MWLTDCVKACIRPPRGFAERQMDLHATASVAELCGLFEQGWVYLCICEQREIELVWRCASHHRLCSTELVAVCGADANSTTVFHDDFLDECVGVDDAALIHHQLRQGLCQPFTAAFRGWHPAAHQGHRREWDPDAAADFIRCTAQMHDPRGEHGPHHGRVERADHMAGGREHPCCKGGVAHQSSHDRGGRRGGEVALEQAEHLVDIGMEVF